MFEKRNDKEQIFEVVDLKNETHKRFLVNISKHETLMKSSLREQIFTSTPHSLLFMFNATVFHQILSLFFFSLFF